MSKTGVTHVSLPIRSADQASCVLEAKTFLISFARLDRSRLVPDRRLERWERPSSRIRFSQKGGSIAATARYLPSAVS